MTEKTYPPERFRELCEEFRQQEETIFNWKSGEYSTEADRIQNFREIAQFIGGEPVQITPAMVVLLYLLRAEH